MEFVIREMEEKDLSKVQDVWRAVNMELTYSHLHQQEGVNPLYM